jgi:hypothetical protein
VSGEEQVIERRPAHLRIRTFRGACSGVIPLKPTKRRTP